jgi:hypothetical protein
MPRRRYKAEEAEEIVAKMRQVEVLVSQGQNIAAPFHAIPANHLSSS